jgi:hypothetical protein
MKNLKENTKSYELGRLLERSEMAKRQTIVEAWKGSGYLYGLKGRDLGNMATLAENQKRQILRENNTTADMAVFDTIAIPMIRRQNALMVSPNLISVQPLSYPNGIAFFLDYKVSNTKKPIASTYLRNGLPVATSPTAVGGGQVADDFSGNTFESTSGYDRHYNNQGYDNSKGRVIARGWNPATSNFNNTSIGGVDDTANAASFSTAVVNMGGAGVININVVDFDLTAIGGITMDQAASIAVYDATGVLLQGRDYFVQRVIQNYTDFIMSTGRTGGGLTDTEAGPASTGNGISGPGQANKVLRLRIIPTVDGLGAVNLRLSFSQYLNLELYPAFSSELKLEIKSVPIQTQIHKMKTAWTVELAQDLMAYHAIDAEAELTQLLAEEVAAEKDRLIIRELINLAGHFEVWNADFANSIDPNPANTVFRGTESTYNQTLLLAVNRADGKIRKSTKRGGANWMLISSEGAAKLVNLDTFKPSDLNEEGTKFAAGVERIGTVNQKYTVYVDPHLPAEVCLLGRKGTSFFDTGYVYCPYIEYMLSPVVLEQQDFNPRRQIASRFGTQMLNNKFYAVVWMKGIEQFTVFQDSTTN